MYDIKNISNIKGYDTISKNQKMFNGFLGRFLQSWGMDARENIVPISIKFVKDNSGKYLRFDYEFYGKKEWLHVTSVNNWY
ncbi:MULTISPECIES: hypothetical protein [Clostridium]|uniref:Uncharacterized protein n=1 Tax=Clostridium frigoriphilum TaxID=443253 RepID=A0ABU7UU44_9CLOT|nr:hypothetical protein [Clostridium sp. DSM 17811]MBU3098718.1 hypothetical protein [Clostridium sp. DSM 17811]